MTLTPRLAALAAVLLIAAGCTGDDEPADVARTDPTSGSTTDATDPAETPTSDAIEEPALVFYGGSGMSSHTVCGSRAPTYLSVYEEFDVNQEVRLGKATLVGGGRLFGEVFVAPTNRRGPNDGTLSIDGKPIWGGIDNLPEWRDRVPLQGQLVQPGAYGVFVQVKLRPDSDLEGIDFSYVDSNTTGSSRLDVSASIVQKCRD